MYHNNPREITILVWMLYPTSLSLLHSLLHSMNPSSKHFSLHSFSLLSPLIKLLLTFLKTLISILLFHYSSQSLKTFLQKEISWLLRMTSLYIQMIIHFFSFFFCFPQLFLQLSFSYSLMALSFQLFLIFPLFISFTFSLQTFWLLQP